EDFFLDASDRKYDAGERHFASHRNTVANRSASEQTHERGDHRCASGRAIFLNRSGRHVNMDIVLLEEVRIDAIAFGIGANPGQSRGHGFLHDLAEVTCLREALSTPHAAGFDEDDVATDGSPDEADGNTGLFGALIDFAFGAEFRHAQEFANDFRGDDHLFRFAFGEAASLLTRDGADFAFEIANAGFARKAVNDFLQAFVGEFELFSDFETMFG